MKRVTEIMSRLSRRWLAPLRDQRGAAAVEFGLMLPVVAAMAVPIIDVSLGVYTQQQVRDAAEAGARYVALHGFTTTTAIQNAVTQATGLSSLSATPAPTQSCGCPTSTGIAAATCGATCPNGQVAGYYATVNAQYVYTPPFAYSVLGKSVTLTAQSVVRYQ